jgi:hypothetical protein
MIGLNEGAIAASADNRGPRDGTGLVVASIEGGVGRERGVPAASGVVGGER